MKRGLNFIGPVGSYMGPVTHLLTILFLIILFLIILRLAILLLVIILLLLSKLLMHVFHIFMNAQLVF